MTGTAPAAIRAWAADVNTRGGLNGHPVKVITADDGADPGRAQAIVRRMVEEDRIVAVLYPYGFDTLGPTIPYLESKDIPVLGNLGAEVAGDNSELSFNPLLGATEGLPWEPLLTLTTMSDKKKLGFLYCREVKTCAESKDKLKTFLPYQGVTAVWEGQVSLAQPDYTAECLSARKAGADALVIAVDAATAARFVRSCRRQSYDPLLVAFHQNETQAAVPFAKELAGSLTGTRTAPYDSPQMSDYRAAVRRYQPKAELGGIGAGAWVVGKLLEKVAASFDATVTSRQIVDAMYSLHNETLGGLLPGITFPRSKDRRRVNSCTVPLRMDGQGRFVPHDPAATFVCAPGWTPGG